MQTTSPSDSTPNQASSVRNTFNWGWGIAAFYMGFVVFILFMVWNASRQDLEMVSTDYYKKELTYQSQIDKETRTSGLNEKMKWELNGTNISLQFPTEFAKQDVEADVLFYRPNDSRLDFSTHVKAGMDSRCELSTAHLKKGLYHMQINWRVNGNEYYNEAELRIP